jgi:hypothetical protein
MTVLRSPENVERRTSVADAPVETTTPDPTVADLDGIVNELSSHWAATITLRRQAADDVGYREIYVYIDDRPAVVLRPNDVATVEVEPGRHRLRATNTLFRKIVEITLAPGEHVTYLAANTAGRGTYSFLSVFVGFIGAGPLYLTFERDDADGGTASTPAEGTAR